MGTYIVVYRLLTTWFHSEIFSENHGSRYYEVERYIMKVYNIYNDILFGRYLVCSSNQNVFC